MYINKQVLISKIKTAQRCVRILGVLAFDLDWNEFKKDWLAKINKGDLTVEIIREPNHFVYMQSIIASDKRISREDRSYELGSFLNILEAPSVKLYKYLVDNNCYHTEPINDLPEEERKNYKQCFSLRTCYLPLPISVINIDDENYIAMTLTKFNDINKFELVDRNHPWETEFNKYFDTYFNNPVGAIKYSTEFTQKKNRLEVIQSFDEKRNPTGILPRDSFLNTVQVKLVVWGLIFTRDGKILIHKRKTNAKDNQGMWDKSVGGHVAVDDIDTVKAVARELAEELFAVEAVEQGDYGKKDFFTVNSDKMIFLGEWLPDRRYIVPFEDVNNRKNEYYYFRLNYPFSKVVRNSERHLPDGHIEDVSVFADVYVCIAAEGFEIDELKNSEYLLLELYELKEYFNDEKIPENNSDEKKTYKAFRVTPDLKSIIRSSLWDDLSSFSDYIKENYQRKTTKNDEESL